MYAPGTEFAMDVITMIGNTGTYLDSPFHRYADGGDLAGARPRDPGRACPPRCFHLDDAGARGIPADGLLDGDAAPGAAVLLHTGWDAHFGTPAYATGAPFLTEDGRAHPRGRRRRPGRHRLAEHRRHRVAAAAARRTASCSPPASTSSSTSPAWRSCRRAARCFTAAPPAVEGFGTFPVRAFAELPADA